LEETGLIVEVGRWVLTRASAQYARWSRAGLGPPRIAVNVSALQLGQSDFLASLDGLGSAEAERGWGLDLEITESVFVDDLQGNVEKLAAARQRGHLVSIDDFGTGYSSLAYLSRLPIDVLKIDRSFIMRMMRDPQDMALVTTIIALAQSLDCKVVAEGVERAEEAQLLRLLRCDQIQGYLVTKPLPASDVAPFFAEAQQAKWARQPD
jgi:EAL domain-containing protein (putative c-di-GMP-specific phosphodiesterase class I)